jgi:hypothetical protein
MDKLLLILMFSFSAISHSQQFNIRNYGAKGDGKSDDTPAFERAIADLYRINLVQKKHVVLFLPSGEYLLSKPIILNKYISIEGQFVNSTIIKITSTGCEGIILEDNKAEKDIYNGYNSIKNLSIHGPDFDKNSFAWKDNKRNNPKSVGIKIMGLRNRVENCVIDGFLWSGIELSSTYYNFITQNFIRNNRVGICIDKTSTTTYVINNEIRTNAIGIIIQNQSYANFVNNNLIEANISNFLENDTTEDAAISLTKGIGILLQNTSNNFIQNNYFELHFINIALANTNYNEISSNFMAIGDMMPAYSKNQSVLKFFGDVKNNRIIGNQTLGTNPQINNTKMIITDGDYSTNTVDFGKKKNNEIKTEFLKKGKNAKKMPQFPTF